MSDRSNNQGRAYEYAWARALYDALSPVRAVKIAENSSLAANRRAWSAVGSELRELYRLSAEAAVGTVLELEPLMAESGGDTLELEFQKDSSGTDGDVRDLVIRREPVSWEVGLSIKHNHDAAKHSRLGGKLDFGREWYGVPCGDAYWDEVKPVFDRLEAERIKGTKWRELADKERSVYAPLLNAFMREVNRAYELDADVPRKMVEYIIGKKDYYKVVSHDRLRVTLIHTFNVHGTLNKPSRVKASVITVPTAQLPTELVALKFKRNTRSTVEMYLNNGWQLNFRIHNASAAVEPSLKFDIQFVGMPTSVLSIECRWGELR